MTRSDARSILLVDDDDNLRRVVEYQLTEADFEVVSVPMGRDALEILRHRNVDLMITDVLMPQMDGLQLLDRVQIMHPDVVTIVITAHGEISRAVRAMQLGAIDFLEKPFSRERILVAVGKALEFGGMRHENRRLRALVQEHDNFENMIGSSAALKAVLGDLRLAADSDATVLISGESGTGKELAARALHLNSRRRRGPFIVVNCGAIPETLMESELFGHCRGSFTGAVADQKGKFELASGGTIFLDEVGELARPVQPKLLRVLQEGEMDKIGGARPLPVDVRVVAATNQDLEACVKEGSFRQDLWFRLNVVPLRMPPLRERVEDIPVLAETFLHRHAQRHGRQVPRLTPGVFERFEKYDWPGNVRELENLMERLVVLCKSSTIAVEDLPGAFLKEAPRYGGLPLDLPAGGIVMDEIERGLLQEAMRRSRGNQSAAARFLGISRQTLIYRLQKFGLR